MKILITGASGNIGLETVKALTSLHSNHQIIAAVRNIERAQSTFKDLEGIDFRTFDFEKFESFEAAFHQIDVLFLLRPPHISDVPKYFLPLLQKAKEKGIEKIVFLSVQGAERSKVIPHNKIENLILQLGFQYIFVRPSYFMQNLSTALKKEIAEKSSLTLPSGDAKFNWIDAQDIGQANAHLILEFEKYSNESYEITGEENLNFQEVAEQLSECLGRKIRYRSINPIRFYFLKKKELKSSAFALVMLMLHYLPRFQKEPNVSSAFEMITQSKPKKLKHFIKEHIDLWES